VVLVEMLGILGPPAAEHSLVPAVVLLVMEPMAEQTLAGAVALAVIRLETTIKVAVAVVAV
jgi:hypothetical protein